MKFFFHFLVEDNKNNYKINLRCYIVINKKIIQNNRGMNSIFGVMNSDGVVMELHYS